MSDKYAWIKDKSNPKVIELLRQENERTFEAMKDAKSIENELYQEILGKTKEDDSDPPYNMRGYEYYKVSVKKKDYPVYYRKKLGSNNEELLLDLNELAQGHDYINLGGFSISPDNNLLAYSIDFDGSELYGVYVKNLTTSECELKISPVTDGNLVWSSDQEYIYYITLDETHRPYRVMRHAVAKRGTLNEEMYVDHDKKFHVELSQSKDLKVIFAESHSKDTSEIWFLHEGNADSGFKLIEKRTKGILYDAYLHNQTLYILTNLDAENFKIVKTSMQTPEAKNWSNDIPYEPNRRIEHLEIFENHIAIFERYNGLKNLRILDLATSSTHDVSFQDSSYTLSECDNEEFNTEYVRFEYESPITPESTYEYNMRTRGLKLIKRREIPSGYEPTLYSLEYFFVAAHDGAQIPVTLVKKKSTPKDGTAPLLLNGYGAYEISKEPYFKRSWFSLLDRGWCVAIAHIRGGGEKGRSWYEQGKFLNKKNTFHDFISVAEHLLEEKYAAKGKISILGGSAGGLLMGAVVNIRPDLWNCVLALVPFVDVFNTMSDESLPLTITEYDEWGNPNDESYKDYILSYSPYDNISTAKYPAILATGGLNDPRVGYWEPAKWILKLRDHNQGSRPLLLKTDLESGHGGPSGRYEQIKEESFYLSFIILLTT